MKTINNASSATIDISSLSKGIYYVGIEKGNKIYYKKLVINTTQTEMTITSNLKTRSVTGIDRIKITTPDNISVLSRTINNATSATIDISSLSKGIYYVGIEKGNKTYYKKLTLN